MPPSPTGASAAASTSSEASSSAFPVRSAAGSSILSSAAASSALISSVAGWRFLRLRPRPPRRPRRLLRRGPSALPSSSFPAAASSASVVEDATCSVVFSGRLSGREISLGVLAVMASVRGAVCRLSAWGDGVSASAGAAEASMDVGDVRDVGAFFARLPRVVLLRPRLGAALAGLSGVSAGLSPSAGACVAAAA